MGGTLAGALAERLRITKADAGRRIAEAADLGARRALTGEQLAPVLTATAAAQATGSLGDAHIRVIRSFFTHLPHGIDSAPARPPKPTSPTKPLSSGPNNSPPTPTW